MAKKQKAEIQPEEVEELVDELEALELPDPQAIKNLSNASRAAVAFRLRVAGVPYETIAAKLGYASGKSVEVVINNRVKKLAYTPENLEQYVKMELHRLDLLQMMLWQRAMDGDLKSVDRLFQLMKMRSDYLGLRKQDDKGDNITTQNNVLVVGGDKDEFIAQLQAARAASNGTPRLNGS